MDDFSRIAAYADGHLTGSEAAEAEAQIASDPQAKAVYDSILILKQTLCSKLPSHNCPTTLSICQDRIRELRRVGRTEAIVGKYSHAMAVGVFLCILAAGITSRMGGGLSADRGMLQRSLAASVAGSSGELVQPNRAEAWLQRELHGPSVGLRLVRVERLSIDGHVLGRKIYSDGSTNYVLLEMPGFIECCGQEIEGYPGFRYSSLNGTNAIFWSDGTTGFVLSAPVPLGTLLKVVSGE